jgi:hypothetical protein
MTELAHYISFDGPVEIPLIPGDPGYKEPTKGNFPEEVTSLTREDKITAMEALKRVAALSPGLNADKMFQSMYGSNSKTTSTR